MPRQLTFDLPRNVALGIDDFFVSDANAQAYAMVRNPDAWPNGKLALIGPAGSGKTHLARIFAAQTGARIINAPDIAAGDPLPETCVVIENADTLATAAEEWLFHAHNHLATIARPLLVTARTAPNRWGTALPDLASRMAATTPVTIASPDDPLLTAVLLKHFQDRQLTPAPDAVAYLIRHLPRSFEAVRTVVASLDREALAQSKALTRPFVRDVLDKMTDGTQ